MGSNSHRESTLPLKIVLGSLADQQHQAPSSRQKQVPPATFILGTSYYDYSRYKKLNKDGTVPMADRKGPFEHFRPRSLLLSTIRVTSINISTTLSTYFSDQLQSEQRMEELVDSGKLTPHEADELNEEWEEREWKLRIDALPKKIGLGLVRFHAITAFMRFYEMVLGRYILKIDGDKVSSPISNESVNSEAIAVMDKLTRDPYQASKRTSQLLSNEEHSPGKVISRDGIETSTRRELASRMFSTCLWANVIPFLAELTVQQGVLFYGYGVYYMEKKRKKKERENRQRRENGEANEEDECVDDTAYALSMLLRSCHLTIARSMSWVAASAGGAVGAIFWPGWGTVFGIQIGDTIVGSLTS